MDSDNQQRSPEQGNASATPTGGAIGKPKRQALARGDEMVEPRRKPGKKHALEIETDGDGPVLQEAKECPAHLYEPGTSETYRLRGSEVYSDLYYAGGSVEALTGYSIINSTLYTKKSGSTYKALPYTKYYVGGSADTIYKRGNQYPDTLYVGGEEVIVRRRAIC